MMPDEMDMTQDDGQHEAAPEPVETNNSVDDLPSWAQDMIRGLRDEAASRRVALKKHEEEARQREQQRLAEQGQWKELAESRAKELSDLQPYRDRAEALETMLRDSNKHRIEQIPEDMRALVPTDYAPEKLASWLDANISRLTKPIAPRLDGGASGGSGSTVTLTDEEKQVARATGMSLEDYAKYKERIFGR
jgi:phage I-like protein